MKRFLLILLALVITLSACSFGTRPIEKPVSFYYTLATTQQGDADSLIQPERRESAGFENNPEKLINAYLKGPVDSRFVSPFPKDTIIISMEIKNNTLYLRLSNRISRLKGIDLFVACACLTLTATEITDTRTVVITSESGSMDGHDSITMDANSIHFIDVSASYPSEAPTQSATDHTATTDTEGGD